MLLSTLGARLLGNMLAGKGIVRASSGNKKREGIPRAGSGKKRKRNWKNLLWKENGFLMLPHPLTSFEIQRYYQNEPRPYGIYSRNNLPKK